MQDAAGQPSAQQKGVAITSFVLGLLSLLCLGLLIGLALILFVDFNLIFALSLLCLAPLTGLAAILCGHVTHNRARRSPGQYGGAGFAIAGFVMGYCGLILLVMFLPALATPKHIAHHLYCNNNMKQIGLSFRTWAIDHDGNFPFNLSTNKGGTLEWCRPGADGFDRNAFLHFQVMSNELSTPIILVCPADSKRHPALNFLSLRPENVSYQLRTGTNINENNPQEILAICPICNQVLLCDGTFETRAKGSR
jgi:hypothetical protein